MTAEQHRAMVRVEKEYLKSEKTRAIGATKLFESEETTKGTRRESWLKIMLDAYEEGASSR